MITIVNYGMGNIGSILNMLKRQGHDAAATSNAVELEKADKIILPGVGAFDTAMGKLKELGLIDVLNFKALEQKVPVLGICLGMQILTRGSEEGRLPGLGWIDAETLKFSFDNKESLKIPHMGWNVAARNKKSILTEGFDDSMRFYFVHSYHVKCANNENSILKTAYGIEFESGIQHQNIYGVQFHPEKSHKFGMKVFSNFTSIV